MLITDKEKHVGSLISLWQEVFGDDEDYIKLYFKEAYYNGECFADIVGNKVVSGLYLLKCLIKYNDKVYNGRYLYAAATLPEYRGKGLMAKLIREAQDYIEGEKLDFIALVPANDGLYDYYSGFDFIEAMYKYKFKIDNDIATMKAYREITDSEEFCKIRNTADCDMLIYDDIGCKYAFECLGYSGSRVFYLDENSYYVEGEELLCSKKESAMNLINNLSGESVVYTNCPLNKAEKIRNGMIYYINDELKNKEIYMNIALD